VTVGWSTRGQRDRSTRDESGARARGRWHTHGWLASLGDGPIGPSPRVMNSALYIYTEN
jgi:hypothetical protein